MSSQIVLVNPKYVRNLASAVRAAACFGASKVVYTGVRLAKDADGYSRLPRELRMKAYDSVEFYRDDKPLEHLDGTPIAVEIGNGFESLLYFCHPEDAIYVFGPEDGSIPKAFLKCCHRFVTIPTLHCLNLAMATNVILYDRVAKSKGVAYGMPQEAARYQVGRHTLSVPHSL